MAKVISITNQKGGVGKTTTSINLSAALVKRGQRILLLDMDPQGNASVGLGIDTSDLEATIYDVLLNEATAEQAIVKTESGVDVMTANGDLAGAQVELLNEIGRELRLKKALEVVRENYDYVFIDCPPALNVLTINALVASDTVMIPMQCEYFALEGLSALISTISKQLQNHFGEKVYQAVIPRNVRLAEAPSYGEAAISYSPTSKGAKAYIQLADEMLSKAKVNKARASA